jgi:hypothetical protein
MKARYIFLGFSGLKTELRTKLKIEKPEKDLLLWFSTAGRELRLHDFDKHQAFFILAVQSESSGLWKIFLDLESHEHQIILEASQSVPIEELAADLNQKFWIYGHLGRIGLSTPFFLPHGARNTALDFCGSRCRVA